MSLSIVKTGLPGNCRFAAIALDPPGAVTSAIQVIHDAVGRFRAFGLASLQLNLSGVHDKRINPIRFAVERESNLIIAVVVEYVAGFQVTGLVATRRLEVQIDLLPVRPRMQIAFVQSDDLAVA